MYWLGKFFSNGAAHWNAAQEVFIVVFFSFIPFFSHYFFSDARAVTTGADPTEVAGQLFGKGQIYLMAFALYGTIFWLAIVRGDRPRHGFRILIGTLATLMIFPIVGFFGPDPTFSETMNNSAVWRSYYYYAGYAFLYYLAIFYLEIEPPSPEDVLKAEGSQIQQKYRKL